jgi:hypothetical protein
MAACLTDLRPAMVRKKGGCGVARWAAELISHPPEPRGRAVGSMALRPEQQIPLGGQQLRRDTGTGIAAEGGKTLQQILHLSFILLWFE